MSLPLENLVATSELHHRDRLAGADAIELVGGGMKAMLARLLEDLDAREGPRVEGSASPHAILEGAVYVAAGASVEPTAYIQGPAYIGEGAEVRHGAYARGGLYLGPGAVLGHATEAKNALFFDGAKAGHFAYVGDSMLGRESNLGAGTKLANLKIAEGEVGVRLPGGERVSSGLRKLGALLGDGAQTGCNAVLSPGAILLPETAVLPCAHFRGTLERGRFPAE